jgi:acyl-CoA synthetase (AMP-forming)/AMP-acid ligase II
MLQMLLDHPRAATTDFSRVQYVTYGAASVPLGLLKRAIATTGCQFVQAYGLTENPIAVILLPEDHSPEGLPQMASVGRALPRVELRIVGEDGRDVAAGATGEIWLRSPGRMKAYWHNPEATAEAVTPDGWIRTGDAASLDEKGYVYLRDRIKDLIISGGENVYPAEVENVLYDHPKVKEVAVVGVPDPKWGEVPLAVVVPVEGTTPGLEELRVFANDRLARYKLPRRLEIVSELPRNASNKVLRRVLRHQYSQPTPTTTPK